MDLLAAVGLTVDGRGAIFTLNQYTASATNAGRATEKFERTTRNLTYTLGTLGGLLGVRQLVEYADTWTLINSRVRLVTESHEQARAVQQRLFEIAQSSRNTLAATAVLYTRLALNAERLGRSHEDLLGVVSAVNHGLLVSGSTGVEAAQSMRQLAQALGAGKLQGDEFRTVMEAMPTVAEAIATQMGVTFGELYKLSRQGKISTQTIIDAMLKAQKDLEEKARNMPMTIGQGFTILRNSVTRTIGIINMATSASTTFGKGLRFVADNMTQFVAAAAAGLATFIAYRLATQAWIGTIIVLKMWVERAAIQIALMTSLKTIADFLALAKAVRGAADAMALMSLVSGGVIKVIAAVAALGAGYLAYKYIVDQVAEATKKWEEAQGDLLKKIGAAETPIDDTYAKLLKETNAEIEDMIRLGHQRVALAALEGTAQKELEIRFEAVNKRIEARRKYEDYPALRRAMLGAIDVEERLALEALRVEDAIERASAALKEQQQIVERFAENLQRSLGDVFYNILNEGIDKFSDLFKAIKAGFFRLVADMAAAKIMARIGVGLTGALQTAFGATPAAAAAVQAKATASAIGSQHWEEAGLPMPVEIKGITATASKSWAADLAQYLGPVLGGFFVGQMVGGMTSNRALGTVGGAASGAAVGFMFGGPVGAAIGGVAGAVGGFIGASKKHAEEAEKLRKMMEEHRMTLLSNNDRLEELRRSFSGNTFEKYSAFFAMPLIQRMLQGPTVVNWKGLTDAERSTLLRLASEAGITLLDSQGKYITGATRQLVDFVLETIKQMTTFGRNLDDLRTKQDAYNKLFDVTESPAQKMSDAYSILREMAPALMEKLGLANLNLTTAEGREALLEGLRAIYTMIASGQLTPELLGAFTDKNQLLDAILRVKDGFDALDKQLTKVTTDFPRAMDIIYYEQKFGRYGKTSANPQTSTSAASSGSGFVVNGNIVIQNNSNETGEQVLAKVEAAAQRRRARGGRTGVYERTE